jgi:hypothetical protein
MSDPQEAAFLAHIPRLTPQQLGEFSSEHGRIVSFVARKNDSADLVVAFSDAQGRKLGPFALSPYLAKMLRERIALLGF